ncbi:MAG: WG repeat-containing protein, partial [Clostridia bacterium]
MNATGDIVTPAIYTSIDYSFSPDVYRTECNGLQGLIRQDGFIVTEPVWNCILRTEGVDTSEYFDVASTDHMHGMLSSTGEIILPPVWQAIGDYSSGLFVVKTKEKWGVVNKKNQWIFLPKWDYIWMPDNDTFVLTTQENEYSIIMNAKGEQLLQTKFTICSKYQDVYVVEQDDLYGLMALDGTLVSSPKWNAENLHFNEYGLLPVESENQLAFVNKCGDTIVSFLSEQPYIPYYAEKKIWGLTDVDTWTCFNEKGEMLLSIHGFEVEPFCNGLAFVKPTVG